MEEIRKIKIFLDKRPGGIVQPTGTYGIKNANDFFVSVQLLKEVKLSGDYVDIALDPNRFVLQRQFINPYFIELSFFEDIDRVGSDSDLPTDQGSLKGKAKKYNITINR